MSKILIIKHGSLGDIISSTSAITDIKNHYKESKITLLTSGRYKNLFERSKFFENIIIDERYGIISILKIIKRIIRIKFDIIIDLQNSQRTSFYIFFLRLFTKSKINGSTKFSTVKYIYSRKNMPSVINGLSNQIEMLGIKTTRKPNLDWLDGDLCNIKNLKNKNFFIINPSCSKNNIQKKWPAYCYAQICTYLLSKDILPVVIGSKDDKETIDEIINKEDKILNLLNKSPLETIYQLSKKAKGAISNDTGPAHLIAASGCKIHLILSGFSNPNTVIPQGNNVTYTQSKNIDEILVDEILKNLNTIFKI